MSRSNGRLDGTLLRRENMKTKKCRWAQDDNGAWETECGNLFEVTEGTPYENDMKFCPYCRKTLVEFVKADIDG